MVVFPVLSCPELQHCQDPACFVLFAICFETDDRGDQADC